MDFGRHALCFAVALSRASISQACERRQAGERSDEQSRERLREGKRLADGRSGTMEFAARRKAHAVCVVIER